MTTILHVEDDETLAELVKETFAAFGFRGTYVIATSVNDARRKLEATRNGRTPDLVISDMNLPDGTGLDVVREIRSDPTLSHVPILILSGDVDPATVKRAYGLGANSYVSKGTRQRSISDVMRDLYSHWLKDAVLPATTAASRTREYISKAISVRSRKAAALMRLGEQLGAPDGEFWMDLALRECNVANLLAFLGRQLGKRELSPDLLKTAEAAQRAEADALAELEHAEVHSHPDVVRHMRVMIANIHAEVAARVIAELFPAAPVAMVAMREVAASALEEIAAWVEAHVSDADLRASVPVLRADATRIRARGTV